jgi:hypothetical protein
MMEQNPAKNLKAEQDRKTILDQLSSLSDKTKTAYEEALHDFRDSQNMNSTMYFMGKE